MARRFLVAALGLTLTFPASAADWPRFQGPNGTGSAEASTPLEFTKVSGGWKTAIPGQGHSSPIVVGGRIYLQSASDDGSKRSLISLDAKTGEVKWTRDVPGSKGHTHKKNSLASNTPACDGERVYAIFWDGKACALHAFDIDGKPVWAVALGEYTSQHGASMSPMVFGGKVFVNYDQDGAAEMYAFDAKTGKKAWSAPRKPFRANPATPIVRELPGGKAEIVVASTAGLTGYDPATGKENWSWDWKFAGNALRTVGSPVLANGIIVATSGDGSGSRSAVAVTAGSDAKMLWERKKGSPYVPCSIIKADHVYWVGDDGIIACASLKSGEIIWSERVFNKAVSSSPIIAGDKILAVAEDGKAVVFKASPEGFEKLADGNLAEAVFASPAAADGRLYIRGTEHLFCFSAK